MYILACAVRYCWLYSTPLAKGGLGEPYMCVCVCVFVGFTLTPAPRLWSQVGGGICAIYSGDVTMSAGSAVGDSHAGGVRLASANPSLTLRAVNPSSRTQHPAQRMRTPIIWLAHGWERKRGEKRAPIVKQPSERTHGEEGRGQTVRKPCRLGHVYARALSLRGEYAELWREYAYSIQMQPVFWTHSPWICTYPCQTQCKPGRIRHSYSYHRNTWLYSPPRSLTTNRTQSNLLITVLQSHAREKRSHIPAPPQSTANPASCDAGLADCELTHG